MKVKEQGEGRRAAAAESLTSACSQRWALTVGARPLLEGARPPPKGIGGHLLSGTDIRMSHGSVPTGQCGWEV